MKTTLARFIALLLVIPFLWGNAHAAADLRAPAYPLVTIDPYTSVWSFGDTLYSSSPKHWTGSDFPLIGVARVDGIDYRFMGVENSDAQAATAVPNADLDAWTGHYTTEKPQDGWELPDYDDSSWASGQGAFGAKEFPSSRTLWNTPYIWVRREINIDEDYTGKEVFLEYTHDDGAIFYVNGIKVLDTGNSCDNHRMIQLTGEALSSLHKGRNVIAAYCNNIAGPGIIDFGINTRTVIPPIFTKTAHQVKVNVFPTTTEYEFLCGPVKLQLSFTAPLLLNNLDLISRPVNYISYRVTSGDGKTHRVQLYFEVSPLWAMNVAGEPSTTSTLSSGNLAFVKCGTKHQNILGTSGDNVRINWGYSYLAADTTGTTIAIDGIESLRTSFAKGAFASRTASADNSRAAIVKDLGTTAQSAGHLMVGYDDIYSVQYFGTNLRPYWNRTGKETIISQFIKADKEYNSLIEKCALFNMDLTVSTLRAGGNEYSSLCALAYRQSIAAHKLVQAPNGDLLFYSKENSSNGSIGTVDITYPTAPMYLYYNPKFVEGMMNPIFYYAEEKGWNKPFAAHDTGVYPLANGNTYPEDMPVEESGNMLILTAALAKAEGNALYAGKHWATLTKWADFLLKNGLDPSNQLCTDDFAGHLAHNANLSVKAILGIASYGYIAEKLGYSTTAKKYTQAARSMAREWMKMADDGDHYRLAFDKPGTWSQKYNLVWDKIMGWNIFPKEVAQKEINFYLTKQNEFGLPLDCRQPYSKTDWIMWTATLSSDKTTFMKFISPVFKFMNVTTDRVPMTDWPYTDRPTACVFHARSVVGGYFIKMLEQKFANPIPTVKPIFRLPSASKHKK